MVRWRIPVAVIALVLGLTMLPATSTSSQDTADESPALQAQLNAISDGGTWHLLGPHTYNLREPLVAQNRSRIWIDADPGAILSVDPSSTAFTGKAVLNLAGSRFMRIDNLRIHSAITDPTRMPTAGLAIGRGSPGDGGGGTYTDVWIEGYYALADFYDQAAEVWTWRDGYLENSYANGACYYNSAVDRAGLTGQPSNSNTRKRFEGSTVMAQYSGNMNSKIVVLEGWMYEMQFLGTFFTFGQYGSGVVLSLEGDEANAITQDLTIEDVRVEGADSPGGRFILLNKPAGAYGVTLERISENRITDYLLEILQGDWTYGKIGTHVGGAKNTRLMHVGAGAQFRLNHVTGLGDKNIVVDANAHATENWIDWPGWGHPLEGDGVYEVDGVPQNDIRYSPPR